MTPREVDELYPDEYTAMVRYIERRALEAERERKRAERAARRGR